MPDVSTVTRNSFREMRIVRGAFREQKQPEIPVAAPRLVSDWNRAAEAFPDVHFYTP